MNSKKQVLITGFALFSMFFGAGNLILPPFLGKNAGESWLWVTIGFFLTAVIIPFLGILAHARIQGTMYDFAKKISSTFSTFYCVIMYTIAITLPAPRTASVTHEIAIAPFFNTSSLVTSSIYFLGVLLFAINRSKVLDYLGKFLTPIIIIIIASIIFVGIFSSPNEISAGIYDAPFVAGLLEGYQTFDAIAAVVVGGILVISLNINTNGSFQDKKQLITKAGIIAGLGLLFIYAGLIMNGAFWSTNFATDASRTTILNGLSTYTLGKIGTSFLSVLVALACFTTAVGIVTGTADFVKGLFNNNSKAYTITVVLGCILGVLIGQFDVSYIIDIALPALMFIYPITIVLIILNVLNPKYTSVIVFRVVVLITFTFSIPDFLQFFIDESQLNTIQKIIPFAKHNLGWVLPAVFSFVVTNLLFAQKKPAV
ncbi:branched-chain amino acid transport system II carrier protein [Tenacibaculum geojense]|uniref:Branched-chain amino acid transport system II carrier protein n=1 Tax=Tenacibaculum geojense TaxID=915352 RepID=A0ABW3JX52_9FLAO